MDKMARTPTDRIEIAAAAFEAGFLSMAAKKRAQEELSRAYTTIRDGAHSASIKFANGLGLDGEARTAHFNEFDLPFDLHQVRERHFPLIVRWAGQDAAELVSDMISLRNAIKDAPMAPAPVKPEVEVKAAAIRQSIIDEMEARKVRFVEALDLGRYFAEHFPRLNKDGTDAAPAASLPVTVNAHWVWGHKGAQFARHFFYLNGRLTALNTIMAVAEQLNREAGVE